MGKGEKSADMLLAFHTPNVPPASSAARAGCSTRTQQSIMSPVLRMPCLACAKPLASLTLRHSRPAVGECAFEGGS